jgi:Putative prokaryotic signal transducing protein
MSDKPQRVFVASGEVHGQQIRAFLEAAGIATEIRGESLRHTHGLTLDGLGAVEIFVAEADAERARELLEAADSGEFRLPDADESRDSHEPE